MFSIHYINVLCILRTVQCTVRNIQCTYSQYLMANNTPYPEYDVIITNYIIPCILTTVTFDSKCLDEYLSNYFEIN